MNEIVIIALAGFTTGITTVLFGFGGGFVVVPFVYQLMLRQPAIAGNAMHVAVATSTAVMIFNAGWVSYRNWRAGRLAAQTLFPLLWFIAIGAVVGSCLAGILSENIVRALFILYMLATISDCLLRKGFFTGSARRRLSLPVVTGGGVIIGTIAALLGVGGSVTDGAPATATRVCNAGVRQRIQPAFFARGAMRGCDLCRYWLAQHSAERISGVYQPENFRPVSS